MNKTRLILNCYYMIFYSELFITLYAIFTLNFCIIATLLSISFLQSRLFKTKNPAFIKFVKEYVQPHKYFRKLETIYEQIPSSQDCLFSHHPHNVFAQSITMNLNARDDPYSKVIPLASRFLMNIPIIGLALKLWGVENVDKQHMMELMHARKNIGIVPGGFEQATLTTPKAFRIYIIHRKGFVKLALMFGYKIIPVLVLNEHKIFKVVENFMQLRLFLCRFKIPGCIPYLIFPDPDYDIYSVVGKAIKVPTIEQPTNQDVDYWHQVYIQRVKQLYEKYKHLNQSIPLQIY